MNNTLTYSSATSAIKTNRLADLKRLPLVIKLVLLFMAIVFVWKQPLLGFNISGLAWVIPLAFSLMVVVRNMNRVTFPYFLWLPWALLLFTYLAITDYSLLDPRVIPIQRTLQLLSPLVVGMAVSTCRPTSADLLAFLNTCSRIAYVLIGIVLFKLSSFLVTGFGDYSGMASEMTTITLLCSLAATRYIIIREKRDILLWALLVTLPIINVTRTAIVCALLTFPLTFAPLSISRRIIALTLIALTGLIVFNTERVQNKMFFSGKGTLMDISKGNEDFATSGRSFMFEKMSPVALEEPLTGHGTGMGETFIHQIAGNLAYPHNDWLLTFYDYGLLGVSVYIVCILLMVRHALLQLRKRPDDSTRILLLTGAAAYIPFALLMSTDNIMVYASFFGNLHFCILGLAYGALWARADESNIQPIQANRFLYRS